MRKTKIVCTLGPASENKEKIRELIMAGMNVARLNFSHGTHAEHLAKIEAVRSASNEMGVHTAIMLDTKGPEIRTGIFPEEIQLVQGQHFTLTIEEIEGDETRCAISYKELYKDVRQGTLILLNDGLVELKVEAVDGTDIICIVQNTGSISSNKGINVPGVRTKLPAITEKDYEDLMFAAEHHVDLVAASFIRRASDVHEIRGILNGRGGRDIRIISKIENVEGVENLNEIVNASYGIMIARGDLGVEMAQEQVPPLQKKLIRECNSKGKPVITATQMLDSMTRNPRPTRAEVADVANAVYDGTDAIMLSGETAVGKYPVEAVKAMAEIAIAAENSINYTSRLKKTEMSQEDTITNAIAYSTCKCAQSLNARVILTPTTSGHTAMSVAKFRPETPIIACVYSDLTARRLALVWGVIPLVVEGGKNTEEIMKTAVSGAVEKGYVENNELVVITAGIPVGIEGNTNIMRIHIVSQPI